MVLAVKTKAKGDASLVEHDVIEAQSVDSDGVNGAVRSWLQ
jgi:uncharacterized protein with FMN-binding domain